MNILNTEWALQVLNEAYIKQEKSQFFKELSTKLFSSVISLIK